MIFLTQNVQLSNDEICKRNKNHIDFFPILLSISLTYSVSLFCFNILFSNNWFPQ